MDIGYNILIKIEIGFSILYVHSFWKLHETNVRTTQPNSNKIIKKFNVTCCKIYDISLVLNI